MSSPLPSPVGYSRVLVVTFFLAGLVFSPSASQADTSVSIDEEALTQVTGSDTQVSFWVDAAPLPMVIRQLASLSGRTAEIEVAAENEVLVKSGEAAENEAVADTLKVVNDDAASEARDSSQVLVSGRFSGSLINTLTQLSANYPVTFDLDGDTLSAMIDDARYSVSVAVLSNTLDDTFKSELLASSWAGNSVEFREDAVRVSGHPAFVRRQSGYITKALAAAGALGNADPEAAQAAPADTTIMADAGSAEVLVDIRDEDKPPAEQANLSTPIRWVTDIPGFHTF